MSDDDQRPSPSLSPPKDTVCVCFHVPLGKLVKHARLTKPRVASQMSDCYGAGTGCGWCIPFLERIFEAVRNAPGEEPHMTLSIDEYIARRKEYLARISAARMRDEREGESLRNRFPTSPKPE